MCVELNRLRTIGVLGATGAIGRALGDVFEQHDADYRVVSRSRPLTACFPHADAVPADLLDAACVERAVTGLETIFFAPGIARTDCENLVPMTRNVLAAAARAGVRRLVAITSIAAYGVTAAERVSERHAHAPSGREGAVRNEQEQLILSAHDAHGLRTLVVHLPGVYGPHADRGFVNHFMREALAGKAAPYVGSTALPHEYLFVPDAAETLIRLTMDDGAFGRCWNLGGAGTITGDEFFAQVELAIGHSVRVHHVNKLMLHTLGLFIGFARESAEMFELAEQSVILDDSALHARIANVHKTSYADGIARTIAWMREHPIAAPDRHDNTLRAS